MKNKQLKGKTSLFFLAFVAGFSCFKQTTFRYVY